MNEKVFPSKKKKIGKSIITNTEIEKCEEKKKFQVFSLRGNFLLKKKIDEKIMQKMQIS
jgi:hypothetical protein